MSSIQNKITSGITATESNSQIFQFPFQRTS